MIDDRRARPATIPPTMIYSFGSDPGTGEHMLVSSLARAMGYKTVSALSAAIAARYPYVTEVSHHRENGRNYIVVTAKPGPNDNVRFLAYRKYKTLPALPEHVHELACEASRYIAEEISLES